MEPQESSQADEGEQKAPGLPEVRYTSFRETQESYECIERNDKNS